MMLQNDSSVNIYETRASFGGLDGNTTSGENDIFPVKYNLSVTKLQPTKIIISQKTHNNNPIPKKNTKSNPLFL